MSYFQRREAGIRGYGASITKAEAMGRASAEDADFTDTDNPYRRWEQAVAWRQGFLARRAEIAATPQTPRMDEGWDDIAGAKVVE